MIKKLGIAAACGIALYGFVKFINRHLVVVPSGSIEFPIDAIAESEPGSDAAGMDPGSIRGVAATGQAPREAVKDETSGSRPGVLAAQQIETEREASCG